LVRWRRRGKRTAILSGRTSAATTIRATELGITHIVQGATDKLEAFRKILQDERLEPEQACAIGDDTLDIEVLQECGLAVAVADAAPTVLRYAHYVTLARGGRGAVREVIELILRCQGHQG
jgi:3-deoxy-D-manno-octulosonate 8-phosphate phosphatase (KDO 8-P phosphatase)